MWRALDMSYNRIGGIMLGEPWRRKSVRRDSGKNYAKLTLYALCLPEARTGLCARLLLY